MAAGTGWERTKFFCRLTSVMESFGKLVIFMGLTLVLLGLAILFFPKIPYLGRLPGDIRIQRENFSLYFPITTCLVASAVLSFILWLVNKR